MGIRLRRLPVTLRSFSAMKFSLAQQRVAFLTAACLGSTQVLPATRLG
ncbi:MAG: hypothetical protein HC857_07755, partial [Synechococcales cyanobacterium RU_4_20]|nr:hypothetical protein [Synechococcales cyanobacterium RU_4_20]